MTKTETTLGQCILEIVGSTDEAAEFLVKDMELPVKLQFLNSINNVKIKELKSVAEDFCTSVLVRKAIFKEKN